MSQEQRDDKRGADELSAWVRERLDNCQRIAANKDAGADRDGWLEDAAYFSEILTALSHVERSGNEWRGGAGQMSMMRTDPPKETTASTTRPRELSVDLIREAAEILKQPPSAPLDQVVVPRGLWERIANRLETAASAIASNDEALEKATGRVAALEAKLEESRREYDELEARSATPLFKKIPPACRATSMEMKIVGASWACMTCGASNVSPECRFRLDGGKA